VDWTKVTSVFPLYKFVLNTQTSQVIVSQAEGNMNSMCIGLFADAVLLLLTTEGLELAVTIIYCYKWTLWYQRADEIHSP
jgi:hypothetical protein